MLKFACPPGHHLYRVSRRSLRDDEGCGSATSTAKFLFTRRSALTHSLAKRLLPHALHVWASAVFSTPHASQSRNRRARFLIELGFVTAFDLVIRLLTCTSRPTAP